MQQVIQSHQQHKYKPYNPNKRQKTYPKNFTQNTKEPAPDNSAHERNWIKSKSKLQHEADPIVREERNFNEFNSNTRKGIEMEYTVRVPKKGVVVKN